VYNLGRPEEVSVLRFARMVKRLAKSSSPIVFVAARARGVTKGA